MPTTLPRIPNFTPIGPLTSLSTPAKPSQTHLIILCTWLGAAPKHIAKYASLYSRSDISPNARILLLESNIRSITSRYPAQQLAVQKAANVVLDTLAAAESGASVPKIMLHVFSNGGTNTATQLLQVLKERRGKPLPLVATLMDSCPAKGTYWKSYDAMVLSLPKGVATRAFGALVVHFILVVLFAWIACGNENPATWQRRQLLDWGVVEGAQGGGRVGYLYSKEDRMCYWEDVTEHAEVARGKGWEVTEVLFEGSGHCAHLSRDEERYVGVVREMWCESKDVGTL